MAKSKPKPRTPQRIEQLRSTLLRSLNNVAPLEFREDTLLTEVDTLIPGPVTDAEFAEDLDALYAKGMIDYTIKLGGVKRWSITTAGKAAL